MPRTPLMQEMQRAVAEVAAQDSGTEWRTTRASLVRKAGLAGLGLAGLGRLTPAARAAANPSVVVVGAGLAGLTCAYRLKQAGIDALVFESSGRMGGRCWTYRAGEIWDEGQVAEHGGELIDQGHGQIRNLVQELDLDLDNLLAAEDSKTEQTNWFDRQRYSFEEATRDIKAAWRKIHEDVSAASYPTLFDTSTERGRVLDQMSIVDWINETFDGGIGSKIGQLLDVAYNIEYGAESSDQSALNLLYLLACSGQGQFRVFGPSNEKYHVRDGNDQIPERLAKILQNQITPNAELVAIASNSSRSLWTLTFRKDTGTIVVDADQVVLALPFSILRSSVDFSRAHFDRLKVIAIREQGMGTNSKLHVQLRSRLWRRLGYNGETFSDRGYQNTWEVSRAQTGAAGILVDYTGDKIGASFGRGTPRSRAKEFLAQVEPVLPGVTTAWNGKATIDLDGLRVDARLVLLLEGRPVHEVRRSGAATARDLPLRRRAHVDRLSGLFERCSRDRRARRDRSDRRPRLIAVNRGSRRQSRQATSCRARCSASIADTFDETNGTLGSWR